jgi:hypothetical protein
MSAAPADDRTPLTRGDLAGFPRPVQNVLLAAFRRGAGYRFTDGTHILLFGSLEGKAGSLKVSGSRQAESSVRFVEKWLDANYPVEPERKLEMVKSEPDSDLRALPRGFRVFTTKQGIENEKIATNGKGTFLCRVCGTSMDTAVGASAHVRNGHDGGNTRAVTDVAEEKSEDKQEVTMTIEEFDLPMPGPDTEEPEEIRLDDPRVLQAIALLLEVASDDSKDVIADLEAQNAALQERLNECEARLALVRETLGM